MSFLLDPPALVVLGVLIGRYVPRRSTRRTLAAGIVGIFIVVSGLLYLDILPWWFGEWMSGSDWMLNSEVGTTLEREDGTDVLAVVMFAAYPLWMKLGLDIGRRWGE